MDFTIKEAINAMIDAKNHGYNVSLRINGEEYAVTGNEFGRDIRYKQGYYNGYNKAIKGIDHKEV